MKTNVDNSAINAARLANITDNSLTERHKSKTEDDKNAIQCKFSNEQLLRQQKVKQLQKNSSLLQKEQLQLQKIATSPKQQNQSDYLLGIQQTILQKKTSEEERNCASCD